MSRVPIFRRFSELCLEEQASMREQRPKFFGVQQIEVA
jgi:hypothetical protein